VVIFIVIVIVFFALFIRASRGQSTVYSRRGRSGWAGGISEVGLGWRRWMEQRRRWWRLFGGRLFWRWRKLRGRRRKRELVSYEA